MLLTPEKCGLAFEVFINICNAHLVPLNLTETEPWNEYPASWWWATQAQP